MPCSIDKSNLALVGILSSLSGISEKNILTNIAYVWSTKFWIMQKIKLLPDELDAVYKELFGLDKVKDYWFVPSNIERVRKDVYVQAVTYQAIKNIISEFKSNTEFTPKSASALINWSLMQLNLHLGTEYGKKVVNCSTIFIDFHRLAGDIPVVIKGIQSFNNKLIISAKGFPEDREHPWLWEIFSGEPLSSRWINKIYNDELKRELKNVIRYGEKVFPLPDNTTPHAALNALKTMYPELDPNGVVNVLPNGDFEIGNGNKESK